MVFVYSGVAILAYLVGSIPTGFLIARFKGIKDIRMHGSGTIGATNVARTLGGSYFFVVFFIDFLKAFLFLALVAFFSFEFVYHIIASLGLLIGNGCSIFLHFQGGKGVATSFGILAFLQPFLLGFLFLCWLAIFLVTKTVGIASVLILCILPLSVLVLLQYNGMLFGMIFFMSTWCLMLHRKNIKLYCDLFFCRK